MPQVGPLETCDSIMIEYEKGKRTKKGGTRFATL